MSAPPPQLSPDGKFYWDGDRWVPMPTSASPPATEHVAVQVRGQMPSWAIVGGLVLCFPLGLVMVGFAPWRVGTKVAVGLAAIAVWILIFAASAHR